MSKTTFFCGFCGKYDDESYLMLGAPGASFICSGCVKLCVDIEAAREAFERDANAPSTNAESRVADPDAKGIPFTPEQDARVAEIVGKMLADLARQKAGEHITDIEDYADWFADRLKNAGAPDA